MSDFAGRLNRRVAWSVDVFVGDRVLSSVLVRGSSLVCLAVLVFCAAMARGGDRVPDDDGVRRYGLRNGLEVVLVPSEVESRAEGNGDQLQLWLMVRGGTIEERDEERGVASLVSMVIRRGIGGLDESTLDEMLVGEDVVEPEAKRSRGAYVMLDQAFYTGQAPTSDAERIGELLAYYTRVLDPEAWALSDEGVEDGRGAMRAMVEGALESEPGLRSRQRWMPRLLGEGPMGTRLDMPELTEIDRLSRDQVMAFAQRTYSASRATLLVVGDTRGVDLERLIAGTLGSLPQREPGELLDAHDGLGGEQVVFEQEPGWDQHIVALLWAGELRGYGAVGGEVDEQSLRARLIDRVGDEVVSQRIERLGPSRLGECEISFDRFEIARRVRAWQCVVQRDGVRDADWRESLSVIVSECDRLAREGAVREEIVQARGAMLAGWHRDAEEWRSASSRDRARDVHWMLLSGLPIMNPERWDRIGTRLMSTISDDEINASVRSMLDVADAKVLVTRGGESSEAGVQEREIAAHRDRLLASPLAQIDEHWMRTLGGDVLDAGRRPGRVEKLTQHAPSGTWGATLSSGVNLWARPVGEDDRVELCAMLWGSMFRDGSLSEAEIDAAMLAWRKPSSESRDAGWLAVFLETHGIRVRAERVMGGVQLVLRTDRSQIDAAMELMTLLLDRPMIDPDAFAEWSSKAQVRWGDEDPLDLALAHLFCEAMVPDEQELSINDAQRVLARIVHGAQIDIGIAGAVNAPEVIERGGELLGSLSQRDREKAGGCEPRRVSAGGECTLKLDGDRRGLVVGMRGDGMDDLDRLRAIVVASMVLDDRIEKLAERRGVEGTRMVAQVVMSEALGDRWALIVRTRGDANELCEQIIDDAMRELDREGIRENELEQVKNELVDSIDRVFDSPRYWSVRMSMLGQQGRGVETLWSIRDGYAGVDAHEASEALRSALGSPDRFRVIFESPSR
ncbi:MAG: insulinase family protein [Phycisphaerales bacterium]